MEYLRFALAVIFITVGVVLELISIIGVFRFGYVLPRMHAAAIGDTGALFCVIVGLMFASGLSLFSAKLFLVLIFLWTGSAVSSHVLSRMVVSSEEEEAREHTEFIEVEVDKL